MPVLVVGLAACSSGGGPAGSGGGATTATTTGTGGATTTTSTTATGDAGGDTWGTYAQGFFAKYCVECHNPSDPARDYDKLADVMTDSALIRCGVAATKPSGCGSSPVPKQFPISDTSGTNPKPTDAERQRIVAWIEAGLPQ